MILFEKNVLVELVACNCWWFWNRNQFHRLSYEPNDFNLRGNFAFISKT